VAEYLEEHGLSKKIEVGINKAVKAKAADPHAVIAAALIADSPMHTQLPGLAALLSEPMDTIKKASGKNTGPPAAWLKAALTSGAKLGKKKAPPSKALAPGGGMDAIGKYLADFSINDAAMSSMNKCVEAKPNDPFGFIASSFVARAEIAGLMPELATSLENFAREEPKDADALIAALVETICPAPPPSEPAAESATFLTEEGAAPTGDGEAAAEEPAAEEAAEGA